MTVETAAARAHAAIRRAVMDGTYPPGTMLSENDLAATLGVSRTPVRTALARLEDEGWITIFPKRGALVRTLSQQDVVDLVEARLLLEPAGVRRASTETRRRLAAELEPLVAEQRAALERRDVSAFVELTLTFHRAFLASGGNAFLTEVGDRLSDRQRHLLHQQRDCLLDRSDQIAAEHLALLGYLDRDDPDGFEAALREHVAGTLGIALAAS